MALDEALLLAAGRDGLRVLRLYAWNPATLSFGRNEPAARRYDRLAIAARGIATVRRPTGGRAVWHHHEVTYAVAAPADTFGSLRQTYHEIHAMLAAALGRLGARVTLAPDRTAAQLGMGACFATPAGGEVLAAGGKVIGSAQVRRGNAFLQHGSIILEDDQPQLDALVAGPALPSRAVGLAELIPGGASWDRVAGAIADTARSRWMMPAAAAARPEALAEQARALAPRFRSDEWTWRR
jgi:lipoate-protein ligase A